MIAKLAILISSLVSPCGAYKRPRNSRMNYLAHELFQRTLNLGHNLQEPFAGFRPVVHARRKAAVNLVATRFFDDRFDIGGDDLAGREDFDAITRIIHYLSDLSRALER